MKCIDELPASELKGKRVLVRAGLDLPLDVNGDVADVFRLQKALATLQYLKDAGARIIIICKIGRDPDESNEPIAEAMKQRFPVFFVPDITGMVARDAIGAMKDGESILLENLQRDPREIAGDDSFARELASLAEMYVNDGFPSAHRASASMIGIPKFLPSYAGIQFRDEVRELSAALHPPHPSLAIIGGAKFETKDPIIRQFLDVYDHVCVVGAIANDVLKAKGFPIGRSRISEHAPGAEVCAHPHLLSPVDVTVERSDKQARVKRPFEVESDDKIVDIGPDSVAELAPHIVAAKFILWNGPTGLYEEGYSSWTHAIAELIAKSDAQKVIGGGDTIAAIQESGVG
ncbi:MAG: phosphoglycerate kinase, partial [Candidatus Paceibacterota bacterium]